MPKIHTVTLDEKIYPVGYKVVTESLKSLGLRKNPNIVKYPVSKWYYLSKDEVEQGSGDWGGIWVARTLSNAKNLSKYMKKHYSKRTRIFKATLDQILYHNSYRVKTNGINLYEEVL